MSNNHSALDKSKDSLAQSRDKPSNFVLEKHVVKKEFSVGSASPKNSIFNRDQEKKEFSSLAFNDILK